MASRLERSLTQVRDGRAWRIGQFADVAWIQDGTTIGYAITRAIPPVFEAYATLLLPCADQLPPDDAEARHEQALMAVLTRCTSPQPWWLGYLDTGPDDVVFPDAPKVELYADWHYVLVEAGPEQASIWRRGPSFKGVLPDLMFPADRSWLVSTLWDDVWTSIGGSAALIGEVLGHPYLMPRGRRVTAADPDSIPPGYPAI